MYKFLIIVHHR